MKRMIPCLTMFAATAAAFAANTWYVDDDNYDESYVTAADYIAAGFDGTTKEKAFGTIQMAIDATTTKAGDTILVCPGTYDKGGKMFTVSGTEYGFTRVVIGKSLTIESTHGASETHIVGKHADTATGIGDGFIRCVGQSWATSTLKGFTIRDGATWRRGRHAPQSWRSRVHTAKREPYVHSGLRDIKLRGLLRRVQKRRCHTFANMRQLWF